VDRQRLDYGLAELVNLARNAPACCYCGAPLTAGTLTFDHTTPTCRKADYSLANLVVCCVPCNEVKGLLSDGEYRRLRPLLRSFHPRSCTDVLARLRSGGRRYRPAARTY
jgi:5-methylcytosine-specific restriction endonuclease McrA